MKTKMRKNLLLLLSLLMVLTIMPMGVWAEGDGTDDADPASVNDSVAMIGQKEYTTLDEAITEAVDGDIIKLLSSCQLSANRGVKIFHDITIEGTGTELINVTAESLPGNSMIEIKTDSIGAGLTLKDCNVDISNIPISSYGYNAVIIINSGKLVLDNCDMTIDGIQSDGSYNNMHGFWCLENGDNLLSVVNGSNLVVQNFAHNAIEWDGTTKYYFEVKDSTYTSNHTRGGIIGIWDVTFENAAVNVINSSGNGSNGSDYTITNSIVNYDNNGAHGLSAGNVIITDSLVTCKGNKYTGFHVAGTLEASTTEIGKYKTQIDVTGNSWGTWGNDLFAGLRLIGSAAVNAGVTLNVSDNFGVGIRASGSDSTYTFADGVCLTAMTNGKSIANGTQYNTTGGGIWNAGTMTLPADAVICNNHATTAGDDIYNTGIITFGKVGTEWVLDGEPDCTDAIDGWYHDGYFGDEEAARWKAHGDKPYYAELFDSFAERDQAEVSGSIALKAAHGLIPVDPDNPDNPDSDREISKSKTATNLKKQGDGTYISDVTLSLPSAEEELVSDVVFVLDESSCSEPVKRQVSSMLDTLYAQIENTGASIKIGAVQFRGEVTEYPLAKLDENTKASIADFMGKRPEIGGSNMSAGLIAGKKILNADTAVSDSRKYLILVGDGITYIWDDETTEDQENYGVNFANGDTPNMPMLASPDGWDIKHGNGYVPENWSRELASIGELLSNTINDKASLYVRGADISEKPFVAYDEKDDYASTVDIALYKSHQIYKEIASKYRAYVVNEGVESEINVYPFDPSFMNYLADGQEWSFDSIQKEIYYLLDAGSSVTDVIGHTDDYNFDFVSDAGSLVLKVGVETLRAADLTEPDLFMSDPNETARYGFGEASSEISGGYPYVLHYYAEGKDGKSDECFVWDINVPVSNFAPVQLTYSVRLTNPKTETGTYGEYDKDGRSHKASLYTNNSATLCPTDSNGEQGIPENFAKPTVSYTVSSGSGSGGGGGGSATTPTLNKEDHFAYIIGYPEDHRTGKATDDKTLWPVKPNNSITRAEVATIFFRMLTDESRSEYWMQTNPYSDVKASLWYNNAISTLTNGKIINGCEDGTFQPNAPITRAETMKLVNEVLDRMPDKDKLLDNMIKWPDNDENAWYYAHVQEATNSHEYEERTPATSAEKWTSILKVRAWADLEKEWSNANSSKNPGEIVKKS